MDQEQSLTLYAYLRKAMYAAMTLYSYWRLGKTGGHVDPTVTSFISDLVLPIIAPPVVIIVDFVTTRLRIKREQLEKKVGALTPVVQTPEELKADTKEVEKLQSTHGLSVEEAVAVVVSNKIG